MERASAEAYVLTLYRELLAREPPEPERDGWVATLLEGTPPDAVRTAILGSEEYIERRRVLNLREAIARTGLFDRSWYLSMYPDVAEAGLDPLEHYVRFGHQEGRRPSAYFDEAGYRERAQVPTGTLALLDYAERGEPRGIAPSASFDPEWYREIYQLAPGISPLAHFLARKATGRFAPTRWLWSLSCGANNPDAPNDGDPFLPYLITSEELSVQAAHDMTIVAASGLFDENYYLVANNDVADSPLAPLFHYCALGWQEGRNPNAYFDSGWYVATNPDVARLRVNPLVHYLLVGEPRDRRPVVYFEPEWYRGTYGLTERDSPLAHYLANRHTQRVSPNSLFDPAWFAAQFGHKPHRRRDPFAHYLFAGTWDDLQPSPRFDAAEWRRRKRGRRSKHFKGLLHPDKDNPLVDYMLSTYR